MDRTRPVSNSAKPSIPRFNPRRHSADRSSESKGRTLMQVEIRHCQSAAYARDLICEMNGGVMEADKLRSLEAMTGVGSDLWIGLIDEVPVCAWGLVPP